jgi:exodeoxyribonuclease-3
MVTVPRIGRAANNHAVLENMKIISANLNGIRSAANKGFFDWLGRQQADVVCLQEIKAQDADLSPPMRNPQGLHGYFHYADKKGYSGVGLYCRREPDQVIVGLGIADIDAEGRYIRADFGDLSVVSLYLPSGSSSAERQQVKFSFLERFLPHLRELMHSGREVILCGDWNIAHHEIDLKNWKGNLKNSGFLPEERAWLTQVFEEIGFVDVWRRLYPQLPGYTCVSQARSSGRKPEFFRLPFQFFRSISW